MPDVTMCKGGNCPVRDQCHRFTAKPSKFRQSYFALPPYYKTPDEFYECKYFMRGEKR